MVSILFAAPKPQYTGIHTFAVSESNKIPQLLSALPMAGIAVYRGQRPHTASMMAELGAGAYNLQRLGKFYRPPLIVFKSVCFAAPTTNSNSLRIKIAAKG